MVNTLTTSVSPDSVTNSDTTSSSSSSSSAVDLEFIISEPEKSCGLHSRKRWIFKLTAWLQVKGQHALLPAPKRRRITLHLLRICLDRRIRRLDIMWNAVS